MKNNHIFKYIIYKFRCISKVYEMDKFYIKKHDEYMCMKQDERKLYFSKESDNAIVFSNKRFAENIAYDYRANIEKV